MDSRNPAPPPPEPSSAFSRIALTLVLTHGMILALIDFQLQASSLILVMLLVEVLCVRLLLPEFRDVVPPVARVSALLPGRLDQLAKTCQEARDVLQSSLDENVSLGQLLGSGALLLADFHSRLREEEESIKVLLAGGQVARSAAMNIQIVTQSVAEPREGLELMAQELETLALNLEDMASGRKARLKEGLEVFKTMASQLRGERERARGGVRMATRLDDLVARMADLVRLGHLDIGKTPATQHSLTRAGAPR